MFFFLKLLRIQYHPCSCNLLYNMRLFILLTIRINSKCAITVIVNVKFNLTHTHVEINNIHVICVASLQELQVTGQNFFSVGKEHTFLLQLNTLLS